MSKSKTFTIRLPDDLFNQAAAHAELNKTTLADLCRAGLSEKISGAGLNQISEKLDKLIAIAESE